MDNVEKCPFSSKARSGRTNQEWWPDRLNLSALHTNHPAGDPMDDGFDYAKRVPVTGSRCREEGHRGGDDGFTGLVAGRLRPLWRPLHPDGVAQCGDLPHSRRPRRRRFGPDPFCAARQLAGQRQHRQGAPAALAGQAEVRPEALVGRPDRVDRQRRPRVDGVQDLRVRRRPRGCLGARARQLGIREHLARRRALQRRSAARESFRRGADGPHLREPGRAEWQARSRCRGEGHSRDVPPHGDERRGNGGAHRRRPLVRQDPRCGAGDPRRPRARGRQPRGAGFRLEGRLRDRHRRPRHHERSRSHLDDDARQVEQRLLQAPVRVRVGADRRVRPARSSGSRRTAPVRAPFRTPTTRRRRSRRR